LLKAAQNFQVDLICDNLKIYDQTRQTALQNLPLIFLSTASLKTTVDCNTPWMTGEQRLPRCF
jgi:hypothetical protein